MIVRIVRSPAVRLGRNLAAVLFVVAWAGGSPLGTAPVRANAYTCHWDGDRCECHWDSVPSCEDGDCYCEVHMSEEGCSDSVGSCAGSSYDCTGDGCDTCGGHPKA
jgi:hypothetical protein